MIAPEDSHTKRKPRTQRFGFSKTVSLGNDFLQVRSGDLMPGTSPKLLSRHMCRLHYGCGADGIVLYEQHDSGANFRIFNRDGGEAELSGNGMAGCAAVLFHGGCFDKSLVLHTKVGPRKIEKIHQRFNTLAMKVEIGAPDFFNQTDFPFLKKSRPAYKLANMIFYPVSVGNPHVVVLLESSNPMSSSEVLEKGRTIENSSMFPQNTNVEFVDFKSHDQCRVYFYERGVGPTMASSTGSAAVFAVLQKLNKISDKLKISTETGSQTVLGTRSIYILNSTSIICKGEYFYHEDG